MSSGALDVSTYLAKCVAYHAHTHTHSHTLTHTHTTRTHTSTRTHEFSHHTKQYTHVTITDHDLSGPLTSPDQEGGQRLLGEQERHPTSGAGVHIRREQLHRIHRAQTRAPGTRYMSVCVNVRL